jgi:hypothetical protein
MGDPSRHIYIRGFHFDGKLIPLTSDHKHLGITFSEEAKWNKYVENLIKSVSESLVKESLQNGTIISLPFRRG